MATFSSLWRRARSFLTDERPFYAALIVFVLLLLHEAVFLGRVFFERDVQTIWYGQAESFVRTLLAGSWPTWDPWVSFGHLMWANSNTQVLYPPTWLNFVMAPPAFYTLYATAHLLLAAVGLYRLARQLGLSPGGAGTAAVVWTGSGPLLSLVNVWHHFAGASLIPWVLLAGERFLAAPGARRAAVWGTAVAVQMLAGSPDMSLMTATVVAARTLGAVDLANPRAWLRRMLPLAALAALVAVGLSAGQWLPTMEAALRSSRAELPSRRALPLHPLALGQVLSPPPWSELPLSSDTLTRLYDGGHPFVRSLYIGGPALTLAVAGAFWPWRHRRLLLLLVAGGLLFSFGRHTPFHGWVCELFPPLKLTRYASKGVVWALLPTALLAGRGWEAMATISRRACLGLAGLAVFCAAVAGGAAFVAYATPRVLASFLQPELPHLPFRVVLGGPAMRLAASAALCLATAALLASRRRGAALLPFVAAVDLLAANAKLNRTAPGDFYRYRPPILAALPRGHMTRLLAYRYTMIGKDAHAGLPGRDPYQIARYPPDLSVDAGRALAVRLYLLPPIGAGFGLFGSYDPDLLGLYPAGLGALVKFHAQVEGTPAYVRLLQLGAVTHVTALHTRGLEALTPMATYESLLAEPIRLFAVPDPLPRAYVVGGTRVADGEAGLAQLVAADFDPTREVLLAEGAATSPPPAFRGSARIVDFRADRVRLQAELSDPGYLVLIDTYDPDWTARVDGRPVAVRRANVAFRAVPLEAGRHTVELRHRPKSVGLGLALTTVHAALLGLLFWRTR